MKTESKNYVWLKYNPIDSFPNGFYWVRTETGREYVVEVINSRDTLGVANPTHYCPIKKPNEK